MDDNESKSTRPHYRWPWFVLAALILGVVLAVVWMSVAVRRIQQQRASDPLAAPRPTGSNVAK